MTDRASQKSLLQFRNEEERIPPGWVCKQCLFMCDVTCSVASSALPDRMTSPPAHGSRAECVTGLRHACQPHYTCSTETVVPAPTIQTAELVSADNRAIIRQFVNLK